MITQPQAAATPTPDPDEERRRIQTARLLAYRDDGPLVHVVADKLGKGLPPVPASLAALLAVIAVTVTGLVQPGFAMLIPALIMVLLVLPTAPRRTQTGSSTSSVSIGVASTSPCSTVLNAAASRSRTTPRSRTPPSTRPPSPLPGSTMPSSVTTTGPAMASTTPIPATPTR